MDKTEKRPFAIQHWMKIAFILAIYDAVAVSIAYFFALLVRFDFRYSVIPPIYLNAYLKFLPIYIITCIIVFWCLGLYRSLWRFASFYELYKIATSSIFCIIAQIIGTTIIILQMDVTVNRMPVSYHIIGALLQFFFIVGIRFSYRFVLLIRERRRAVAVGKTTSTEEIGSGIPNIMLIGAGNAGEMILRDIQMAEEIKGRVACIIDDNQNKWGRNINQVPIIGGRESIPDAVEKYHISKIYIAIPSATVQERKAILDICKETGCDIKNLPGIYQLVQGQVTVSQMKEVSVEDLLGREPVQTNLKEVFDFIHGKHVLVTGGGGSIGSELCRQIAQHNPKQLIILDIYENSTYELQLELQEEYPDLNLTVIISSIRDSRRIFQIFEEYKPEIVYHAAAHKHVPLMETSPCEVIKNNTIGTYKTAYAAMVNGCERFVLISTDKAVNPTNIMGASKRLCEMIIQSFDTKIKAGKTQELPQLFTHGMVVKGEETGNGEDPETTAARLYSPLTEEQMAQIKTEFVAVRFGNVFGSNGSVIPIFKKQIATGGPVTVTHPDIIRYFMTIPEAVSLVLLAGTYAKGGEIFVLDMGSPVKIDEMARTLIKMSGFKPDVDIRIVYTGLRPGEKLYEEKLMAEEGLKTTENKLIYIGCPIPFDIDDFLLQLNDLMKNAYNNRRDIRDLVKKVVTTYHPESGGDIGI